MSSPPWGADATAPHQVALALRAAQVGTYVWHPSTGEVFRDEALEEILGVADSSEARGYEDYLDRVHPDDRGKVVAAMNRAVAERTPTLRTEHRIIRPGGEVRWLEVKARVSFDAGGQPNELIGVVLDITERRLAEDSRRAAVAREQRAVQRAGAVQRRLEMLAMAADLLDAPLDLDAALQQVADLAVEVLADWCSVDLLSEGGIRHAAVAHRDPDMVALAREVQSRYPPDPDDPQFRQVVDSLQPAFVETFDDSLLDEMVEDEEYRRLVRQFQISSYLVVPLVAAGRGTGVMSLVSTQGRHLDPADVDLALDLGRRAGAAVEKTRLYADLAETSRALQKSLLPPRLPRIPGIVLSAHYRSGTKGLQIGGDFYDAFRTEQHRWWIALGDVCGKGPAAAALTSAVRHTLRAVAPDSEDPADVLRDLNTLLIEELGDDEFASVLLVTLQPPQRRAADSVTGDDVVRLSIASGGHPPPFLRRRDGAVATVSSPGTLMGLVENVTLHSVQVDLGSGDTLLLYTDGATEARLPCGTLVGDAGLQQLFAEAEGDALADTIAERLLRLVGSELRDDLAMMTITASPSSDARPVAMGPSVQNL